MTSAVMLAIGGGGSARLLALAGDRASLESDTSAPPGSTITLLIGPDEQGYALKVSGCRLSGERYRIDGRLVNVSRQQRARLERLLAV
jgi:hypothetical protein